MTKTTHARRQLLIFGAAVLLAGWACPITMAADWPQFLGPHRNGISMETGLLTKWPAGGPPVVWRTSGGVGMSGISVVGESLYTLIQREGAQWCLCLSTKDGSTQWKRRLGNAYKNGMGDGPRATPTVHDSIVFTFTGDGILTALNASDGRVLWSHEAVKELGGPEADYGMACSPLVVGDMVVVTVGAERGTVVAYRQKTGEVAWTAGSGLPAGYSSPALLTVAGTPQIVAFTGAAALGIDPQTGRIAWQYDYVTDFGCNIATPIQIGEHIFLSSGENHGSVMLDVQRDGERYRVREVWASQGPRSTLRNEWQTSIHIGNYLYGLDNVGSAGPITHLTCVDARTGERVWQQPRFGKSNLIFADGKLFFSTMKGELVVVRATPDGYQELGRAQVLETTRQAPALANGRLYLRDGAEIVCVDVRE